MNENPFSLSGKNILISGASSGIGRCCAIECGRRGANLLLLGRDISKLEETYNKAKGNSPTESKIYIHSIDLIDNQDNINEIIESFVVNNKKLDGLIHSAGIEKTMPLSGMKESDYRYLFNINVIAGFQLAKIISKRKNSNDRSSLVFLSSITGLIGRKGIIGYSASKGALISGVRSMALELAERGIRANCISPGTILTPLMVKFLETLSEEEKMKRLESYPLGLGVTEDVAYLSVYLLSDASRWITGQNIVIDGGYTIK